MQREEKRSTTRESGGERRWGALRSGKGFGPAYAKGAPQSREPSGTLERSGEESEESTSVEETEEALRRIIARGGAVRHHCSNRALLRWWSMRRRCGNGEVLPPGREAEGEGALCASTEVHRGSESSSGP